MLYEAEEKIKNINKVIKIINKYLKDSDFMTKVKKFKYNDIKELGIKFVKKGGKSGFGWKPSIDLEIPDEILENEELLNPLIENLTDLLYDTLDIFHEMEVITQYPIILKDKIADREYFEYKNMYNIQVSIITDEDLDNAIQTEVEVLKDLRDKLESKEISKDELEGYEDAYDYFIHTGLYGDLLDIDLIVHLSDIYNKFNKMINKFEAEAKKRIDAYYNAHKHEISRGSQEYEDEDEEEEYYKRTARRPATRRPTKKPTSRRR